VLLVQDVWQQTVTLHGFSGDPPVQSVLPELSLRGALSIELAGVSHPVTLCAPARELDPSPCIDAKTVTIDHPLAYLDRGGAFHFVDRISMSDAVALAQQQHHRFTLPVSVGGKLIATLEWPLFFARPENLEFIASGAGADGPDLHVDIDHRDGDRYVFHVATLQGTVTAVLEKGDVRDFRVISRGGRGAPGASGAPGSDGSDGFECSNGSDGGDGGPGEDGGPGGRGGNIEIQLACAGGVCPEAADEVHSSIFSAGGRGGDGGPGGSGGRGGRGGAERPRREQTDADGHVWVVDPGCSAGLSGRSGYNGPPGSGGPGGAAGRVRLRVVP
jgi:hypothetical protein